MSQEQQQLQTAGIPATYRSPRDLGDIQPIAEAVRRVKDRLEGFREAGAADEYQRALTWVLTVLEPALTEARTAKLRLTPRQRAQIEGLTLDALYKRISRARKSGQVIPGLVTEGRSIFFELSLPAPESN
jgi:hypothetical protein